TAFSRVVITQSAFHKGLVRCYPLGSSAIREAQQRRCRLRRLQFQRQPNRQPVSGRRRGLAVSATPLLGSETEEGTTGLTGRLTACLLGYIATELLSQSIVYFDSASIRSLHIW